LTALAGIFGRATNQIVVLLVTLLAARWLSPSTFGVFAIATALITLARTLLYAGAFEYLLKARPGEEAATECLLVNLALAVVMAGFLVLFSLFTTRIFHSPEIAGLLLAMAPSNLFAAGSAWQEAQLLRANRVRTYYAVATFAEISAAVVAVVLIVLGFGLTALVAQLYARALVVLVAYRILQKPMWSERVSLRLAWRVTRWSSARYGATFVNFLSNYSADVLLGAFLSPAATGLYRASNRIVTGVSDLVSNPTRTMAMTVFSSRAANGLDSSDVWPRLAGASAFLGWTALAGMAAVSGQIVPVVLGAKWAGAAPVITVLCLRRAISLLDGVSNPLLVAYGHVRALFAVQIAMAVGSVILLVFLARFGVVAAAWSTVLISAASAMICMVLASRMSSSTGYLAGLLAMAPVALGPPAAAALAALAAGAFLAPHRLPLMLELFLQVSAGAVAWSLLVLANRTSILDALHALNATASVGQEAAEAVV
jgi:O-antigen/teichoic acid export membrane protein